MGGNGDDDEHSVISGVSSAPSSPPMPLPPMLPTLSSANINNNSKAAAASNKLLGNFPDVNFLPEGGGGGAGGAQETKVIYHIDDETTPYLVKIPIPSVSVTLRDFKIVLNKQNLHYKYFFKSMDADFG